jgi:hypothetical protein
VATSQIDGRLYAVVNVGTFEDATAFLLRQTSSDVAEESELARLARRKRNWIAHVEYVESGV